MTNSFLEDHKTEVELVHNTLAKIFSLASDGTHTLSTTGPDGSVTATAFVKKDGTVAVHDTHVAFMTSFVSNLVAGIAGLTLNSFLADEDDSKPLVVGDTDATQEIRAWVIHEGVIHSLDSQNSGDNTFVNAQTGDEQALESNTSHREAWDLS